MRSSQHRRAGQQRGAALVQPAGVADVQQHHEAVRRASSRGNLQRGRTGERGATHSARLPLAVEPPTMRGEPTPRLRGSTPVEGGAAGRRVSEVRCAAGQPPTRRPPDTATAATTRRCKPQARIAIVEAAARPRGAHAWAACVGGRGLPPLTLLPLSASRVCCLHTQRMHVRAQQPSGRADHQTHDRHPNTINSVTLPVLIDRIDHYKGLQTRRKQAALAFRVILARCQDLDACAFTPC